MRKFVIPVEVEPLEEGGYLAVCELIQGCHAEGETVAEALDNLEDVARILLELQREDGLPPPEGLEEFRPGTVVKAQLVVSVPE
jgi:predicted RNase H-like HicB family nuclease